MSPLCPSTAAWKHQVIAFDGGSRPACSSAKSHTTVWWPRHASFIPLPSPSAAIGRMVIPVHTCDIPAAPSYGMGTPVHISPKPNKHHMVACIHVISDTCHIPLLTLGGVHKTAHYLCSCNATWSCRNTCLCTCSVPWTACGSGGMLVCMYSVSRTSMACLVT